MPPYSLAPTASFSAPNEFIGAFAFQHRKRLFQAHLQQINPSHEYEGAILRQELTSYMLFRLTYCFTGEVKSGFVSSSRLKLKDEVQRR